VALGRLTGVFAWVKRHFRAINLVSGLLLVVFGLLLLTHHITRWSNDMITFMDHIPVLRRLAHS